MSEKIGFYASLSNTTKAMEPIELGTVVKVPTIFGNIKMKVTKVTDDMAELENGDLLALARKEKNGWYFDHSLINKEAIAKVQLV